MCKTADADELPDELSNMLHHMYRLGELRRRRWERNQQHLTDRDFTARVKQVPDALGALWIRTYDTHEIMTVSKLKDIHTNFFTEMYRILVWMCIADMPFIKKPNDIDRFIDYQSNLENQPVLDTLRTAFDSLAALP